MTNYDKSVLEDLVNFNKPIEDLKKQVNKLSWDLDEDIELTTSILNKILDRYLKGEIASEHLEEWANLNESRECIKTSDIVKEAIYKLANPIIEGELNTDNIIKIKSNLIS
ncbi:MAG: hypothetical protein H6625_04385 [Bdellovibrionaceae bacterium]|nr:hypothetical protein [Pseudobdellovibrionaceae bacterium]